MQSEPRDARITVWALPRSLAATADQEGLAVKEQPLSTHDGLIIGSHIAI